ncbi:MAG: (Fe-S)-binding protein [Calditrichaeota bacterium]|nr:(Fe-S)-binding protein [Calditrichota bacterium]
MSDVKLLKPDSDFQRRLRSAGGDSLNKCYQCATCAAVCNLSPEAKPFPRKEMLAAGWGLKDDLMTDPDVWLCYQCNDCSVRCPRGAKPGEVMAAVRSYAFEHFAVPSFMGRALNNPAALPLLFLIPILVIGALLFIHTGFDFSPLHAGDVEYRLFIPHGYIEMLFISGNVFIFALAALGLLKYYNGMQRAWGSGQIGFIRAVYETILEIITHNRFEKCDTNRYRKLAHFLIFFGFMGAMATAGLALIAMVVFHYGPPIEMSHPIKWLGNASGIAMVVGLTIVIVQRGGNAERAGKPNYSHWLFIWMTLSVAATGLLTQIMRLINEPVLAYPMYFVHLVAVFFLLWYAPYSQLGHMFYRTIALVYARSIDRQPRALKAA